MGELAGQTVILIDARASCGTRYARRTMYNLDGLEHA